MAEWTEERRQKASEQAKARISARTAVVAPSEVEVIVPPAPAPKSALSGPTETPNLDSRPDLSRLDDKDKIQSLANLLKVLPAKYLSDYAMAKETIWGIARFEPTKEQYDYAIANMHVVPQRFPN